VQNALNLNRKSANGSGLNISNAVAFITAVAVTAVAVNTILRVGLTALSLPLLDILGLSSYSYNRGWLKYYAGLYRRVSSNRTRTY
jgi:hypothetical protein